MQALRDTEDLAVPPVLTADSQLILQYLERRMAVLHQQSQQFQQQSLRSEQQSLQQSLRSELCQRVDAVQTQLQQQLSQSLTGVQQGLQIVQQSQEQLQHEFQQSNQELARTFATGLQSTVSEILGALNVPLPSSSSSSISDSAKRMWLSFPFDSPTSSTGSESVSGPCVSPPSSPTPRIQFRVCLFGML
jgi:hypothetical protein